MFSNFLLFYSQKMGSYYGCPSGCVVNANGLCSSHGTCAYDQGSKEAYCKCYDGYYDDDCSKGEAAEGSEEWREEHHVPPIFVVLTGFCLMGLCGGVGYGAYTHSQRHSLAGYIQLPQGGKATEIEL